VSAFLSFRKAEEGMLFAMQVEMRQKTGVQYVGKRGKRGRGQNWNRE